MLPILHGNRRTTQDPRKYNVSRVPLRRFQALLVIALACTFSRNAQAQAPAPVFVNVYQNFTLTGGWQTTDIDGPLVSTDNAATAVFSGNYRSIDVLHSGAITLELNIGTPTGVFDDSAWQEVATQANATDAIYDSTQILFGLKYAPSMMKVRITAQAGTKLYGVRVQ